MVGGFDRKDRLGGGVDVGVFEVLPVVDLMAGARHHDIDSAHAQHRRRPHGAPDALHHGSVEGEGSIGEGLDAARNAERFAVAGVHLAAQRQAYRRPGPRLRAQVGRFGVEDGGEGGVLDPGVDHAAKEPGRVAVPAAPRVVRKVGKHNGFAPVPRARCRERLQRRLDTHGLHRRPVPFIPDFADQGFGNPAIAGGVAVAGDHGAGAGVADIGPGKATVDARRQNPGLREESIGAGQDLGHRPRRRGPPVIGAVQHGPPGDHDRGTNVALQGPLDQVRRPGCDLILVDVRIRAVRDHDVGEIGHEVGDVGMEVQGHADG